MFVEWSVGVWGPWVWMFFDVVVDLYVKKWFFELVYVVFIHTDGFV